jgi:hypothetical protein
MALTSKKKKIISNFEFLKFKKKCGIYFLILS